MSEMLDAALSYAECGFRVIPVHSVIKYDDGSCVCTCHKGATCRTAGKHPIMKDWVSAGTTDEDQIKKWWSENPNANIGWAIDEGWCVVDLDKIKRETRERWELDGLDWHRSVEDLLPNTATQITHSGGKHLVFRLPPGYKLSNTVGQVAEHVDIRTHGGQILLEPSVGVSGEYYWEDDLRDFAEDVPMLPSFILDDLRASDVRRQEMKDYSGQDFNQIVRGRANTIPLMQETERSLRAILFARGDDGELVFDPDNYFDWYTLGSVIFMESSSQQAFDLWCEWSQNSYKYDEVEQLRYWENHFDAYHPNPLGVGTLVFRIKHKNGNITREDIGDVGKYVSQNTVDGTPVRGELDEDDLVEEWVHEEVIPPLPDHITRSAGGAMQLYVDWVASCDDMKNRTLALASALPLFGTVFGRMFKFYRAKSNMFILAVGLTGQGKDTARLCSKQLLMQSGMSAKIGAEKLASGSSFFKVMLDYPVKFFLLDELGKQLDRIFSGRASGFEAEIEDAFLTFFGGSSHARFADKSRAMDSKTDTIDYPHASVYATATPTFYNNMNSATAAEGMLSRFLIFDVCDEKREIGIASEDPADPPAELIRAMGKLTKWVEDVFLKGQGNISELVGQDAQANLEFMPMGVGENVEKALIQLRQLEIERQEGEGKYARPVWARFREQTMKAAMVRALSRWVCSCEIEQGITPTVELEDLRWAKELVEWSSMRMEYLANNRVSDSKFQSVLQRALEVIRQNGRNGIARSDLLNALGLSAGDLDKVTDTLCASNNIEIHKPAAKRGRRKTIYKAVKVKKNIKE